MNWIACVIQYVFDYLFQNQYFYRRFSIDFESTYINSFNILIQRFLDLCSGVKKNYTARRCVLWPQTSLTIFKNNIKNIRMKVTFILLYLPILQKNVFVSGKVRSFGETNLISVIPKMWQISSWRDSTFYSCRKQQWCQIPFLGSLADTMSQRKCFNNFHTFYLVTYVQNFILKLLAL